MPPAGTLRASHGAAPGLPAGLELLQARVDFGLQALDFIQRPAHLGAARAALLLLAQVEGLQPLALGAAADADDAAGDVGLQQALQKGVWEGAAGRW